MAQLVKEFISFYLILRTYCLSFSLGFIIVTLVHLLKKKQNHGKVLMNFFVSITKIKR